MRKESALPTLPPTPTLVLESAANLTAPLLQLHAQAIDLLHLQQQTLYGRNKIKVILEFTFLNLRALY